jgi:hypothetical protein
MHELTDDRCVLMVVLDYRLHLWKSLYVNFNKYGCHCLHVKPGNHMTPRIHMLQIQVAINSCDFPSTLTPSLPALRHSHTPATG